MTESVREFFRSLPAAVEPAKTVGIDATYLFEIDGVGTWTVGVSNGAVEVSEGGDAADCTIRTSAESFERILSGKTNPTTAYMLGKLKISGDLGAALKLQQLF
jgi:putative sterol carrier protein